MKYLFGTDMNADEQQAELDGRRYLKLELPQSMSQELEKREQALERAGGRDLLTKLLRGAKLVFFLPGVICAAGVLRARVSLTEGYHNAPWAYWIAGVCLLLAGVAALWEKARTKRRINSDDTQAADRSLQEAQRSADAWLGVPTDAAETDVLLFSYQSKNGEMEISGPMLNLPLRLYRTDEALCLTDGESVTEIPLAALTGLRLIRQTASLVGWNKDDEPKHERYQRAGVSVQENLGMGLEYFCALEWTDAGETWQLLFPAYELPKLEGLTGLKGPALPERKRKGSKQRKDPSQPQDGKVRPLFYWRVPKGEKVSYWFSPTSDIAFRLAHPKLYVLLIVIGIAALFLPWFGFPLLAMALIEGAKDNAWLLLGVGGGFLMGVGLINIVGAWMHQYLGHWVTILCVTLGAILMAASWLLLV